MKNLLLHRNIIRGGLGKYPEIGIDLPKVGLKGHFKVELISRAGIIKRTLEFDNLITDAGLNGLATNGPTHNLISYAGVGTGSTAPAVSDTGLVAEIALASANRTLANGGIADTFTYTSGTPDFYSLVRTYLFDFSQGNGNLTEIGLFNTSSAGTMWTRQLLKDGTGTPTTIVKTSADQLRVTYTLQLYPLQADVVDTITISTVSYTTTIRAANVGITSQYASFLYYGAAGATIRANSVGITARTTEPITDAITSSTDTSGAYVAGNFYIEHTSVWNSSIANFGAGGIPSFTCFRNPNGAIMQLGVSPAFAKDNTKQLTLVTRVSWGRYP